MALAGRFLGSSCAFKRSALQKRQFLVRAQDFRITCFKASLSDHRLRDLRINPRDPEASVRGRFVTCRAAQQRSRSPTDVHVDLKVCDVRF